MATAVKVAPVSPAHTPNTTETLLRELLDVNRQILSTLQQAHTTRASHSPLTRADRAVLATMLPAVVGVYGAETFTARDLTEDDRPAVRLVVRGRSVKQLGASPSNRNIGHTACGCVSIMVDRAFREQSRAAGRSCR
jgi:hypothetical protein